VAGERRQCAADGRGENLRLWDTAAISKKLNDTSWTPSCQKKRPAGKVSEKLEVDSGSAGGALSRGTASSVSEGTAGAVKRGATETILRGVGRRGRRREFSWRLRREPSEGGGEATPTL